MDKKMQKALNEQIREELYSAYLYYAAAAWAEAQNLKGFAHWFKRQAAEEMEHADRFYNFIYDRGGKVELEALSKPPVDFGSALGAMKEALKHEKFITGKINDLLALSRKLNDYPAESMLKWFIDEQVEEEAQATEMIEKIKMVKEDGKGLYLLDKELAQRK